MGCLLEAALGRQLIQNLLETAAPGRGVVLPRRRRRWFCLRGALGRSHQQCRTRASPASPPQALLVPRGSAPGSRRCAPRALARWGERPLHRFFKLCYAHNFAPHILRAWQGWLASRATSRLPNRDVYPLKLRIFTCEDGSTPGGTRTSRPSSRPRSLSESAFPSIHLSGPSSSTAAPAIASNFL